jgi:hypothetical protein
MWVASSLEFLLLVLSRSVRDVVPLAMPAGQGPPAACCGLDGRRTITQHARTVYRCVI